MYNCKFQDFREYYGNEHVRSKDLKDKVQLCIFDPPYNWNMGDHDKMDSVELNILCELAYHVTKPGGTIMIFCGLNQIQQYNEKFNLLGMMVELNGLMVTHSLDCNNYF